MPFYPLADYFEGVDDRRECAIDLDQILLSPPPADPKLAAFLKRWGEPLRELLLEFDTAVVAGAHEGDC